MYSSNMNFVYHLLASVARLLAGYAAQLALAPCLVALIALLVITVGLGLYSRFFLGRLVLTSTFFRLTKSPRTKA